MAKNDMTITFKPEEIMGSEIMKSGEYKYARVGIKKGENEYMTVSYEWKSETVPEFVMGLMKYISSSENKEEIDAKKQERAEEWKILRERVWGKN
jgi:hypothetical protein